MNQEQNLKGKIRKSYQKENRLESGNNPICDFRRKEDYRYE